MSGYAQAVGAGNSTGEDAHGGAKRKRDDGSGIQHRTKRNRYISIACNECKRRKIKCNGETPCQRCGNLNLDCIYSPNCCSNSFRDSTEFQTLNAQVSELKDQVNHILLRLDSLLDTRTNSGGESFHFAHDDATQLRHDPLSSATATQPTVPIDPALQSRPPPTQSPNQARLQGLNKSVLGIEFTHPYQQNAAETTYLGNVPQNHSQAQPQVNHHKDPIWELKKDEALRLCELFEADTGMMYPILDMDRLKRHTTMLFKFIDAISRTFIMADKPGADAIHDQDTDTLKLVIATTLIIEEAGNSELGKKMFNWVNKSTDSRLLGDVNVKDIQILTLTALYHFHNDDESLAWRLIGLTARLCLELGLNRPETYDKLFTSEHERTIARNLFWSIYILDHRWSFGTGRSIAIQESDIDPQLPRPVESSPYLAAMINFCAVSAQCGKYIANADSMNGTGFSKDEVNNLDLQISQWLISLPESLRFVHPNSTEFSQYHNSDPNAIGGRGVQRLRGLLYLRANYLRTSIYRTILSSSSSILASESSIDSAQTAVETAKDTIRILTYINTTSDLYQTRHITYDNFLLAALAAIFLAVCYAPSHFTESSREEFNLALELVRGLSAGSDVSQRLWQTIRGLKELEPKVGIYTEPRQPEDKNPSYNSNLNGANTRGSSQKYRSQYQNDAQRSAAMAMAGLAGHSIDENIIFSFNDPAGTNPPSTLGGTVISNDKAVEQQVTSPDGMANVLTSLFDTVGQFANGNGITMGNPLGGNATSNNVGPGNIFDAGDWGSNDEELNKILKGLF